MGIRLIVEMLDHAPADLSAREKLALVALAESARDETRIGWPGRGEVARRIGASENTAKHVLSELVARGHLERVGGGYRGRRTEYRLPSVHSAAPERGPTTDPFSEHGTSERGPIQTEKGADSDPKGVRMRTPSPQSPHITPLRARADARDESEKNDPRRTEFDAAVETVRHELAAAFGKDYDRTDIADAVSAFLRGRDVTDPLAYVRHAVKKNPAQFQPTPTPPRYRRNGNRNSDTVSLHEFIGEFLDEDDDSPDPWATTGIPHETYLEADF